MKKFKFVFFVAIIVLFTAFISYAQEILVPIPAVNSNSVCLDNTCLSGMSASIIIIFTLAVTLATFLVKIPVLQDKSKWYGKILDKIAHIKITK